MKTHRPVFFGQLLMLLDPGKHPHKGMPHQSRVNTSCCMHLNQTNL